jgi:parallel beta-helix repeat protein
LLRRATLATLAFLAFASSTLAQVPTPAEIAALADEILAEPVPAPLAGEVALAEAANEPALRRGFLDELEALPGWQGVAIVLRSGRHRLEALPARIDRPDLLACDGRRCRLAAPLVVAAGAVLVIDGIELRLAQETGALVSAHGGLFISDSELLGWNDEADMPARTDDRGTAFRPWITGLEDNRTVVRRSRLAHLGYQGTSTFGLAFTHGGRDPAEGGPRVSVVANAIEDLYFGFFSFGAVGVEVIQNEISRSHVYGVDPHDATRDMLIAQNTVTGTRRSHGIILSREIHDAMVVLNQSSDNAGAGLFIDKGSHDVTFARNRAFANGKDGIVVYESRDITITRNELFANGRAGIRVRASADVRVSGNAIRHDAGPGIFVYDWSHAAREPDEEDATHLLPTSVELSSNSLANNAGGDCSIQGEVEIRIPPNGYSDC